MEELQHGALYRFADWPSDAVPRRAAGVYTIWRQRQLVYAGMSGRGAQQEDLVATAGPRGGARGLWTRLNSHASGRRSGDQFNLYVCDRFIVPALVRQQLRQIGEGEPSLDQLTKMFICGQLSYRFLICPEGRQALALERQVRAGRLPAGRPYLNPLDKGGPPASRRQPRRPRPAWQAGPATETDGPSGRSVWSRNADGDHAAARGRGLNANTCLTSPAP